MCESQILCPERRRQGFFLETLHLFPFNSGNAPQTTDVQVGKEHQFYPLNLRVDLFAGFDFSQKIGGHGGVRLSYFGRLPKNFLLGPTAEANLGYRDSQWNLGWKITGAAIYEPTSWLQFQAGVGKAELGWTSTLGINILFLPEKQVNPPPHAQRRSTTEILTDIDKNLKKPDLREYEVCHHTGRLPSPSSVLRYKMDTEGYDDALFGVQRSQVHVEKGSIPFSSKGGKAETLGVRELSVLGNADEEKGSGFVPWVVKLASQPEEKFGNIKVSVTPVDAPSACPDWSPPRPVVSYEPHPSLCLLAELGNWREPMDRESMKFPAKPGKAGGPEAFRTLPGPYQSHPPDDVPKGSPNQCEWGAEQWQKMEYEPALDLVDLQNTPGFREKEYLCVRLMEADNPGADQPLLQSSIKVSTLREHGSAFLGVNPDDERHVFVQWGLGNENLTSRFPLVIGLEIKN